MTIVEWILSPWPYLYIGLPAALVIGWSFITTDDDE